MECDGCFDMLQDGGFSVILNGDSGAEMDLSQLCMQKEIAIDLQEISSKNDILVLCEDIQ